MTSKLLPLVLTLFIAAGALVQGAHHSIGVNYDQSREITIQGVITQIKWINPHAYFRVDVANPDASVVEWIAEMGAFNGIKRAGFPTERFAVGDRITIIGAPGRRDRTILLEETVLKDGTRLNPSMRPRGSDARDGGQP